MSIVFSSGISPLAPFYAIENNDVELRWTFPFNITNVSWYHGDINENLIMTYPQRDSDTEISSDVKYIEGTDSIGIILMNVSTEASGIYTVVSLIGDHRTDYASTNVTVITGRFLLLYWLKHVELFIISTDIGNFA
jgi:hypothetical protein